MHKIVQEHLLSSELNYMEKNASKAYCLGVQRLERVFPITY